MPFPQKERLLISVIHPSNNVAISDFRSKVDELRPYVSVESIPVAAMRPDLLVSAIASANGDVVAIVRGGLERMEVFDSRQVIEAFARVGAYRVLGIGHSVSNSLMDLVPEYRADVPSDAGAHVASMARLLAHRMRELEQLRAAAKRAQTPRWIYAAIVILSALSAFLLLLRMLHS